MESRKPCGRQFNDLRGRAEDLVAKTRADVAAMPPEDIQRLVHELQVHQIELELQNEELRATQLDLTEARDRYTDLYDFAPVGYVTLDLDLRILHANLTASTMLGTPRAELDGQRLAGWIAPGHLETFRSHVAEAAESNRTVWCELEVRRPGGDAAWFRLVTLGVWREDGGPEELRIALIDIAARKRLEDELQETNESLEAKILERTRELRKANSSLRAEIAERTEVDHELRESQAFALSVLDSLGAHVAVLNAQGVIVATNAAWDAFAHENAALGTDRLGVGVNYLEVCRAARGRSADEAEEVLAGLIAVLDRQRDQFDIEYPCHSDTVKRWYILYVSPLRTEAGGAVVSHTNITRMREAEFELRRQAGLIDRVHDAVVSMDLEGVITTWNPGAERCYGYTAAEAIGQHVGFLRFPEDAASINETVIPEFLERGTFDSTVRRRHKSGREIFVQLRLAVVHDEEGAPVAIVGCSNDVTEEKRARDLVSRERNRAQQYLDVANVMLVSLDSAGIVSMINRRGCEILGYSEQEVLHKNWFNHFLPERLRGAVERVFQKLMEGRVEPVEFYENSVITKSGEERIIEWHNAVVRDADGRPIGTLGSGLDVTERRRAEDEVRRLQKEVVDTSTYEKERIGQELHDDAGQALRGLAFSANALSNALQSKGFAEEGETAQRIARELEETLRKVRALARGLVPVELDESGFLKAMEDLAVETEARFGIPVRFQCGEPLSFPDRGTRIQLFRIAQEAVQNAVQHGAPKHIVIELTDGSQRVTLSVRDDGKGFEVGEPSGHGLGLRIMRHRAQLIGAEFAVESTPGHGATVTCEMRSTT